MVFTKVLKTAAYFSRYQVKLRRRRQGKTDYYARRKMIMQDRRKATQPKNRLIVRCTNQRVICQLAYATIVGDKIVCAADSSELSHYGMPVGHTNYAAAYATGLLLARRVLKKFKLDQAFVGVEKANGEMYHVEEDAMEDEGQRPFRAVLDIGLVRSTTGNRVFGALKGAIDGGLYVPHSEKRFPGYENGEGGKDGKYDAEGHRKRIMGVHVAEYMKSMQEEDPEKYAAHFSQYLKNGLDAANLEAKYEALHAAIRANPDRVEQPKKEFPKKEKVKRLGRAGRREKAQKKLRILAEKAAAEQD